MPPTRSRGASPREYKSDRETTKALRSVFRGREDLVHVRVALTKQLRTELERFVPGPIGLFAA
jgi:transposase